ncbi:MAG: IS200/IS605 family transposase [Candidatus Neomarinimicrobiota bacterium]|jgi:REP element-mobilizing transposase RayT
MHTYLRIIYHVIFHTKNNDKTITKDHQKKLYKYIHGILKNKKCHVYEIGGTEDHIHLAFSLHPSVALMNLIHDIKLSSTRYIKNEKLFLNFNGWQIGYAAITHYANSIETLVKYIKNQEEHHLKENSRDEYIKHLHDAKIDVDEKYLF